MQLTLTALGVGIALSLPASLLAVRIAPLRAALLTTASVIQTVPSLALLALMVPLLGGRIGFVPAAIALVLYSALPIVRNTITGVQGVDRAVVEAARGIGMTPRQVLLRVELPLAAPVIIAGVRTSTVWVVGIATLSTPVGATSLGNYIFSGLQTRNMSAIVVGCVAAAVLAITLDALIRLMEAAASRKSVRLGVAAAIGLAVVIGGSLAPVVGDGFGRGAERGERVRIGAKTFTEQYILARVIAQRVEGAGLRAETIESLGSTVLFDAIAAGTIGVCVDYAGTIWANHMGRDDAPDPERIVEEVGAWLLREHGVVSLGPLGFENTYALAMRRDDAERLGVRTIEDLALHASSLTVAGDYEFFARPEWAALLQRYGLSFADRRSMDSTLMYGAVAEGQVDVIGAFSTDGRLNAYDLVVLDDVRNAFPPYDALLMLSARAASDERLVAALLPLVRAIDDEAMRHANMLVDVDRRTVDEAARTLAETVGD
ncbi:MAG: ABC transporter permease subunit [Phycisphaerales bacterium]|nr:MAG: ABC transporter permease subunit [Phycisphaerales bacterium]